MNIYHIKENLYMLLILILNSNYTIALIKNLFEKLVDNNETPMNTQFYSLPLDYLPTTLVITILHCVDIQQLFQHLLHRKVEMK